MRELTGKRIVLKAKRLEDASKEFEWRCDPELSKLDAAQPLKMSYQEFLRIYTNQLFYPSPWIQRLSIFTSNDVYIGNCMYYDIDSVRKEAEMGIMIGDRRYWGMGHGFDVMVTLIDHIFSSSSLRRLYLHTLDWNQRAKNCFEKCGMTHVKNVKRYGQSFSLMDITDKTWSQIRAKKLALQDALSVIPSATKTLWD